MELVSVKPNWVWKCFYFLFGMRNNGTEKHYAVGKITKNSLKKCVFVNSALNYSALLFWLFCPRWSKVCIQLPILVSGMLWQNDVILYFDISMCDLNETSFFCLITRKCVYAKLNIYVNIFIVSFSIGGSLSNQKTNKNWLLTKVMTAFWSWE